MNIVWTDSAISDLARLYEFLAQTNKPAAVRVLDSLTAAPEKLLQLPRLGEKLEEFAPRDIRRLQIGRYEMRYEIAVETIHILRVWHVREDR